MITRFIQYLSPDLFKKEIPSHTYRNNNKKQTTHDYAFLLFQSTKRKKHFEPLYLFDYLHIFFSSIISLFIHLKCDR